MAYKPTYEELEQRVHDLEQAEIEHRQVENELRISEKLLRNVMDIVPAFICAKDLDGRFILANKKLVDFYGTTVEEMTGMLHADICENGEELQGMLAADCKVIYSEKPKYIPEETMMHPDGSISVLETHKIPFFAYDDPAVLIVSADITDRKQAEEALRKAYDIINRSPTVVFLWKNAEGWPVEFVSDNVVRLFGHTAEEFTSGKVSYKTMVHPDDLERVVQEVTTCSEEEDRKEFSHDPYRIITKNGEVKWLDDMSSIKRDEKGDITHYEGIVLDISDRKQAEIEKGRLQSQLQQSQKMEAVGTLAGGIAHDFNNILAIIMGNAELASDDIPDWNPASKSLKEIHRASIRARDMVKHLLAFSRKSGEVNRPINIELIVKEAMEMLRSAVPTSIAFDQHISGDPCNILGDAAQISQVMMNLATNAAHAMAEEGGLLEVTLEKVELPEEKSCFSKVLPPGAYVRLKVRDTGEGMERTTMARIFEPYYTTKEVGKGTGMGLSVVHGIVKRHGGGIRVESELGKGTAFEIYFPALVEMIEEEKEPDGEIKGGSESILFVDDEESMVDLNRQRLERLGYQVKSTTKPLQALEWFSADPDHFDVIITDMTMPRMTGDRLTKEILTIRPEMPVIICTGYSERMSEKDAEAFGVRKYIEKPIDTRNLAAALREVLDEGPSSVAPMQDGESKR